MTLTQLNDLHDDALIEIFRYLKYDELCSIKRVCKRWRELADCTLLNRHVDLAHRHLCRRQFEGLSAVLSTSLRYLHVSSYGHTPGPFLTPNVLHTLRTRCPLLETLILEACPLVTIFNLTDVSLEELPLRSLKVLSLRRSFFNVDQFFAIIGIRTSFPIQVLDVAYCWCISNCDLVFFSRLEYLTELYLQNCEKINQLGCFTIAARLPGLVVLDLEGTKVNDIGVNCLLQNCSHLKKLYLGLNFLTNSSFIGLVPNPLLPDLHRLCLVGTSITDEGLREIVILFPRLVWLQVAETRVTRRGAEEILKQTPPSIQIVLERELRRSSDSSRDWPLPCNHFFSSL